MRACYVLLWAIACYLLPLDAAGQLELTVPSVAHANVTHSFAHQPLSFTKNVGQWPDSVLFRADIGEAVMWIVKDGIYYQFTRHIKKTAAGEDASVAGLGPRQPDMPGKVGHEPDSLETVLIKAAFAGASTDVEVIGLEEQAYTCNYFLGNDPTRWHTDVPNYAAVTMQGIYPGVDAIFRGNNERLDNVLTGPAEAVKTVTAAYSGAAASSSPDGSVVLNTRLGEKRFHGIMPVASEPEPTTVSAASSTGYLTLVYSTYLGGSDYEDVRAVAVDTVGCAYVTGRTYSTDFPTQSPYQADQGRTSEVYVTKLSADGTSLVYSTYLGGDWGDYGLDIAVDSFGCAYVAGLTASTNFPTQSPYQSDQGDMDAFVTKLSGEGNSLVYSTYLGGSWGDGAFGIAVDAAGCAYVTGETVSWDFPTVSPYQIDQDTTDAFVTKLSASGNSLVYSTYLGGSSWDDGWTIAVDGSSCAYVTGSTWSADFPIQSPYQTYQGDLSYSDVFVTKLSASGNSLFYSTYLGGSDADYGCGIAVDSAGSAYVTGYTWSLNFPIQSPFQTDQGGMDVFVTKLSAEGTSLVYSTYLGGTGHDYGGAITVDAVGCTYVTGATFSINFPTQSPYQTNQDTTDVFVTKLSALGTSLLYSTYLGGSALDHGQGIAVDAAGCAYVTGVTESMAFPTQAPYQTDQGSSDAFVTKLVLAANCCTGTTGNVNMTGIIDLSDLSLLIAYLTTNPRPTLPCPAEANVNATGIIDLTDLSLLIAYLTANPRPALPACP